MKVRIRSRVVVNFFEPDFPPPLTPRHDLYLQPGDLVRIKRYEEILATLDTTGSNRGLAFDAELVPYCGKLYRVRTRVEKFINETTGKITKGFLLSGGTRIVAPNA